MATCTYGSSAQAGAPAWFSFTEADIALYLPPLVGVITFAVMGIPVGPQETAQFCSAEPPSDLPTITDYALIAFPPEALIAGTYTRFGNQVKQDKFNALCQCNGATTGGPTDPCTTYGPFTVDSGNTVVGVGPFSSTDRYWAGYWQDSSNVVPTGQRHIRLRWSGVPSGPVSYQLYDSVTSAVIATTTTGGTSGSIEGDATAGHVIGVVFHSSASIPHTISVDFWNASGDPTCTGSPTTYPSPPALSPPSGFPGAPAAPTCGSYQDICNSIQTVLDKLNIIDSYVQLIQRQSLPFAFAPTSLATGLTGTGFVSVQGIIGVRVSLTTVPITWGGTQETPSRLIPSAGSIQASDGTMFTDNHQIHYVDQVVYLHSPWATQVRYNFKPGIVASIDALPREP